MSNVMTHSRVGSKIEDDGDGEWESVEVNGKEYDLSNSDEHDFGRDLTHEEVKEINDTIDRALREGGMLAGRMGAKIPRSISDLLEHPLSRVRMSSHGAS
jgi:hypothetical protein